MKWVMEVLGTATEIFDRPRYIENYDVDAYGGQGAADLTLDINKARKFNSFIDVMEAWKTQSTLRPFRPDGKPNRPLTAFSVSPKQDEEAGA